MSIFVAFRTVLAELLGKNGASSVLITHGRNERGKDIIFYKPGGLCRVPGFPGLPDLGERRLCCPRSRRAELIDISMACLGVLN